MSTVRTVTICLLLTALTVACVRLPSRAPKAVDEVAATATTAHAAAADKSYRATPGLPALIREQMAAGHYDVAEKMLRARLAIRPDDAITLANLGLARLRLGQDAAAIEALEGARATPSLAKDPGLLNELGMGYRRLGRFDEAERAYRKAITVQPGYGPALLNLGILLEIYRQRMADAVPYYRRYLESPSARRADEVRLWLIDIEHRLQETPERP